MLSQPPSSNIVSDKNAKRLDVSQRGAIINRSTDWCSCGQCSPCLPRGCITEQTIFQSQLMSEEGLQYNRVLFASIINDYEARQKYLVQVFDNGKRRHLCYRNFIIFMNMGQLIGREKPCGFAAMCCCENSGTISDPSGKYVRFINDLTVRIVLHKTRIICVQIHSIY